MTRDDIKAAFGLFATGLVVVTAMTSEGPAGFTCQAFAAISLDPPLAMVSATAGSPSWAKVRDGQGIGVSVLRADAQDLATQFATSGIDKFAGVDWTSGPGGAPLLTGALAHIEGTIDTVTRHGDHDLCTIAVRHVASFDGSPLLYVRGAYRDL